MPDRLLVVALASAAGALCALHPLAAVAGAVGASFALRHGTPRWVLAIALLCFGLNALRGDRAIHRAAESYRRAVEATTPPERCAATGTIVSSPVQLGDGGRIDVDLTGGHCGIELAPIDPIRARLYGAPLELGRGDRIEVITDLAPVHLFANRELDDRMTQIARTGIVASGGIVDLRLVEHASGLRRAIDGARSSVRQRIESTFHPEAAPLARALVLGETDLEDEDRRAFQVSGLAHILAVSGTHLVLTAVAFSVALRAILLRVTALSARFDVGRIGAAAAIPVVWLYAEFAGGGGSAVRAAGMLTAAMLTRVIARRVDPSRAIGWSIGAAAAFDPLVVFDVSFVLSAAATAGLLWLSPWFTDALCGGRPRSASPAPWYVRAWATLRGLLLATLAANAACAPVLLALAPTLPLFGVVANVVAAPLGEVVALPVCLAHAVVPWWPAAEHGAAQVGSGALLTILEIARFTAEAGWQLELPPPTAPQLAALAVTLAAASTRVGTQRLWAFVLGGMSLAALEHGAVEAGKPEGLLRVSALDVGQGDSTLIDFPDGRSMLIDGGGFVGSPVDPGERVILPVLRQRRRHHVDVVVVSHPHPDHFGGLRSTLRRVSVGELWDTGEADVRGAGFGYPAMLAEARARGTPIRNPSDLCDHPQSFGGAEVQVLWPCPGISLADSPNDNSFVIRITYGRRAVLLVGDAEHATEERLLASGASLRADLLKVGHHGSRTSSTPAFIDAVAPTWATLSCGVRNRFGHPHSETLQTLAGEGILWARLDRGGQLIWQTDGETVEVERPRAR